MDAQRFDQITRELTARWSRRHAIAVALGGSAAMMVGGRWKDAAATTPLSSCCREHLRGFRAECRSFSTKGCRVAQFTCEDLPEDQCILRGTCRTKEGTSC